MADCNRPGLDTRFWRRTPAALTVQDVRDIRELRNVRKCSIKTLVAHYGVSKGTIRDAIYGDGAYRGIV